MSRCKESMNRVLHFDFALLYPHPQYAQSIVDLHTIIILVDLLRKKY